MPFYLVTHTALAEADDEVGAAKKVLAKLQSDPRVAFTVKFDEGSIKQVSVPNESGEKILKHNNGVRSDSQSDLNTNIGYFRIEGGQLSTKDFADRKVSSMIGSAVLFVSIGVFIGVECAEMIFRLF